MALGQPFGLAVQNAWYSSVFSTVYVLLIVVTGAWLGVIVSFVLASAAAVASRLFATASAEHRRSVCTPDLPCAHTLPRCCSLMSSVQSECAASLSCRHYGLQ